MKTVLGLVLVLAGIAVGIYVGLWVCFVGGIVAVVDAIRAETLDSSALAWGVVRIIFAAFAGYLSAFVLMLPGWMLVTSD